MTTECAVRATTFRIGDAGPSLETRFGVGRVLSLRGWRRPLHHMYSARHLSRCSLVSRMVSTTNPTPVVISTATGLCSRLRFTIQIP